MKLKLETTENATILAVTETIEPSHIPVLKAGLAKLFQSGKKSILLDLTQVTETDFKEPSLHQQIADFRNWAAASGAQIVVVSPIESVGHAKSRAEGLEMLTSPVAQLQALEAGLQAQLRTLEQQKATLLQKMGGAAKEADLKQLQQQNSRLKREIAGAEQVAKAFLKARKGEPTKLPSMQVTQDNLEKLLDSFLLKEGVIRE